MLAWRLNSKIFKRGALPAAQSKIFDRLVPLIKALDGDRPKKGLSLIAIGRKGVGSGGFGGGSRSDSRVDFQRFQYRLASMDKTPLDSSAPDSSGEHASSIASTPTPHP